MRPRLLKLAFANPVDTPIDTETFYVCAGLFEINPHGPEYARIKGQSMVWITTIWYTHFANYKDSTQCML